MPTPKTSTPASSIPQTLNPLTNPLPLSGLHALAAAAISGAAAAAEALLSDVPVRSDVNARIATGQTPLMLAVLMGHVRAAAAAAGCGRDVVLQLPVVHVLLDHNADVAATASGATALGMAVVAGGCRAWG